MYTMYVQHELIILILISARLKIDCYITDVEITCLSSLLYSIWYSEGVKFKSLAPYLFWHHSQAFLIVNFCLPASSFDDLVMFLTYDEQWVFGLKL